MPSPSSASVLGIQVHTRIEPHAQTCTHVHAHTYTHTDTHRHTLTHTHTHIHTHLHTHTYTHTDTHQHTPTHTHIYTLTHTHRHTLTHTGTHTDTSANSGTNSRAGASRLMYLSWAGLTQPTTVANKNSYTHRHIPIQALWPSDACLLVGQANWDTHAYIHIRIHRHTSTRRDAHAYTHTSMHILAYYEV